MKIKNCLPVGKSEKMIIEKQNVEYNGNWIYVNKLNQFSELRASSKFKIK